MELKDLKVGDTLFIPKDSRYGHDETIAIAKVGRKYLTLKSGRMEQLVDIKSGRIYVKDWGFKQTVYRSEDEYKRIVKEEKVFAQLKTKLNHYSRVKPPPVEKTIQAAEILGITLELDET